MTNHRTNLNDNQIHILKLIYKFRFTTSTLLTEYRQVNKSAIKRTLQVLLDLNYINRRYDKSYKLLGKPASYYLTTKSIKILKDDYDLNEGVLRTLYKNKTVGEPFVSQNLNIFRGYINFNKLYPEEFSIFTRAELADFDYFPVPSPNLYLKRIDPTDDQQEDYMLDIFTEAQLFVIKKRIDAYIEHYESGDWKYQDYPSVLIACPDSPTEQKIQEYIENAKDNAFIEDDELEILTTTTKAPLDPKNINMKIWSSPYSSKELLEL